MRFSSLPPSTPLFIFSVLEWTPASGILAHLYPKRSTSLQRLEHNASLTTTEEERRDPRDRAVFVSTAGTWTCFRQVSCCGDVLVLEDAESIDVGPPRRHEYTWQQGPGRLPSVESRSASFGATGGWLQTLASVSQSVAETDADTVGHGTHVVRPWHHHHNHREIPLQDIHSVRRYVFKRPLSLTFSSTGNVVDPAGQEEFRRGRPKSSHHESDADDLDGLEWRYELWGPVGLIFMLRGGARLFLVFASGWHVEQMEEILIDFASGRGLQRRLQQQRQASFSTVSGAVLATQPPVSVAESASGLRMASPTSPGVPDSPALSYASLRLGSPETSFQGAPGPLSQTQGSSVALADAAAHLSSFTLPLNSGTSVVSTIGTPSVEPHYPKPWPAPSSVAVSVASASRTGPLTASPNITSTSTSASSPMGVALPSKPPATGYLYCRPWGEAVRHRRYYFRPVSPTSALMRLSRHRLHAWQKIRQTLGQEPRSIAVDLRQTYLTPSSTHENVFLAESVVDTYAQYKDVVPLGGAVATAGTGDEAPSVIAARRREMELCRARPIAFEALAKTKEERSEWLTWLQAHGATILQPEATDAPHMGASAKGRSRTMAKQAKESFHPLGHQFVPFSSAGNAASAREMSGAYSVDRWVTNCAIPSSSTDLLPPADPAGGARQPQLPLKESDSERGSTSASLRTKWLTNSPMRYPQPHPHPMRLFSHSPGNPSRLSTSSSSPDPVFLVSAGPHHHHCQNDDFDEHSIVVEDDERGQKGKHDQRHSPPTPLVDQQPQKQAEEREEGQLTPSTRSLNGSISGGLEALNHTVGPSRPEGTFSSEKQGNVPQVVVAAAAAGQLDGKRPLLNGDGRGGAVGGSAHSAPTSSAAAPSSPGEEGATAYHARTGTELTVRGAPHPLMYLEDTSSYDEDTTRHPSPSLSNTAPANSPHSRTPSLPSPSALRQRDTNGDAGQRMRRGANSFRSTPISPHSTAAEKSDKTPLDAAALSSRPLNSNSNSTPLGDAAATNATTEIPRSGRQIQVSDLLMPHQSETGNAPSLSNRTDTALYLSETCGADCTPSRSTAAQADLNSAFSLATGVSRASAAASPTQRPRAAAVAVHVGVDERGSHHSNASARHSQDNASASLSYSPSPDVPSTGAPAYALRAKSSPTPLAAAVPSAETSSVIKALFSPPEREDEAVQTSNAALRTATSISSSLNGSPQQIQVTPVTETYGESGERTGLKIGGETLSSNAHRASAERRVDPRLLQFFTPVHCDDGELERNGSVPSSNKFTVPNGSVANDSLARPLAVKRSLRDSPPPQQLPPRVGSLTFSSQHDTPVDSGLRRRAAPQIGAEGNRCEGRSTPLTNSMSDRATYRGSEHLSNSLPLQSREMMEQRKRAFRDSLFVNQEL